jgi:hypothetical protein
MGNCHPISMQIGTQTNKNALSSKVTKAEVIDSFLDGRRRHVGNSSECHKMSNHNPIAMKIGTQTKQKHAKFKSRKSGSLRQKNSKN